jgi:hypothetical protein
MKPCLASQSSWAESSSLSTSVGAPQRLAPLRRGMVLFHVNSFCFVFVKADYMNTWVIALKEQVFFVPGHGQSIVGLTYCGAAPAHRHSVAKPRIKVRLLVR